MEILNLNNKQMKKLLIPLTLVALIVAYLYDGKVETKIVPYEPFREVPVIYYQDTFQDDFDTVYFAYGCEYHSFKQS